MGVSEVRGGLEAFLVMDLLRGRGELAMPAVGVFADGIPGDVGQADALPEIGIAEIGGDPKAAGHPPGLPVVYLPGVGGRGELGQAVLGRLGGHSVTPLGFEEFGEGVFLFYIPAELGAGGWGEAEAGEVAEAVLS